MAADVPLAQVQGSVGQVHQDGAGVFQRGGDGKPHAARPGAQVQHAGVARVFFQAADGQLGQHLRVHSGDEGGRIDEEPQAHEVPLADDVGDGFPCQTPVHVLLDGFSDGVGGVQGKVPVELLRGLAGGGADEVLGLQLVGFVVHAGRPAGPAAQRAIKS